MPFETIVFRFQDARIRSISCDLSDDSSNYDCTQTYIVPAKIEVFGLDSNDYYDDDYDFNALPRIGAVEGSLILCKQMDADGHDMYSICDAISSDLEHLASVLMKEGLPDDDFEMNPQDIFYIEDIEIVPDYRNNGYGSRILQELPLLIREYLHVMPGILTYIPTPLEDSARTINEHELAVSRMLIEKAAKALGAPKPSTMDSEKKDSNIVALPADYQFDEDDVNRLLGRRMDESAYPVERKNGMLFAFYEKNGFVEIGDTRLMVKSIYG